MKRPSFDKYVNKQDRINESVAPVVVKRTRPAFNLEVDENLSEWKWPFSRADTHKEANKTKQTETDLKNLFAYFKAVNYTKHPKLKDAAFAWMKATKDVLGAIQAERASYNANAKTAVSGPTATPNTQGGPAAAPKPTNPLLGRENPNSMLSGRQQQ